MASASSILFSVLLRLINKKGMLRRQFRRGRFNAYSSPYPPKRMFRTFHIETSEIDNRRVFTLRPKHYGSSKHVLFLHGGAFVTNFIEPHWSFLEDLITNTHCIITAPDYPLAPDKTYKEALEMTIKVYQKLLLSTPPDDVFLFGDSAGGGLALALAQMLKDKALPQPGNIVLLSPWLDLTLSNPDIAGLDSLDPFIGIEGLRLAANAYAGGDDLNSHLLSPIYGPLNGLGKISVFVGTKEILIADTRKLKRIMDSKGIPINYQEFEGMIHDWMFLHFPESQRARTEIEALIK